MRSHRSHHGTGRWSEYRAGDKGVKRMGDSQASSWVSHENFHFLGWHMNILFSRFFIFLFLGTLLDSLKPDRLTKICLKMRKLSLNTIREISSDFKVIVGHPNGHILKILGTWKLYVGKKSNRNLEFQ